MEKNIYGCFCQCLLRFISFYLAIVIFVVSGFFSYGFADSSDDFLYAAKALLPEKAKAILLDADTGEVFFEKDSEVRVPIASTTKIMTLYVVLNQEKVRGHEFFTSPFQLIGKYAKAVEIEGSCMGLKPGDTVTVEDLIYGLMMRSGNDAANVLAIKFSKSGSVDEFVGLMNATAEKLGLENTEFFTPSGLDPEGVVNSRFINEDVDDGSKKKKTSSNAGLPISTAADLAKLTRIAIKNPRFVEIWSTPSKQLNFGNPPSKITLYNTNKLIRKDSGGYYEYSIGGKTGFTKEAGRCLVSAAKKNGRTLICITFGLKGKIDWELHKNLYEYGFSKYRETAVVTEELENLEFSVFAEEEDRKFKVKVKDPLTAYLTSADLKRVQFKVKAGRENFAPIKKDEIIGKVECCLGNKTLGEIELIACDDVLI